MANENKYETTDLAETISGAADAENEQKDENKKRKAARHGKLNLVILIFSFLIAMAIWLFVMGTEDGEYEKTITLVPVRIVGVSELEYNNNMSVIAGYNNTVTVTLKGKRSDVNKYTQNDIYAYVDVSKMDNSDRQNLPIIIDPLADVSISEMNPVTISVYADVIDTVDVDVVVKPTYTINGDYFVDKDQITKSVDKVSVTGPAGLLTSIGGAVAETDIGKLTGSVKSMTSLYLVDKKGGRIQNPYLKLSVDVVEISIPVYLRKTVNLTYEYNEKMFEDYNVSINLEFDSVSIIGDVFKVNSVKDICVLNLTRSHFKQDTDGNYLPYETTVDIELPDGVRIDGGVTSVYIKAEISKKIQEPPAIGGDSQTTAEPQVTETPDVTQTPDADVTTAQP